MVRGLEATTGDEERGLLSVIIGVDENDPVYDAEEAKSRLKGLFEKPGFEVHLEKLVGQAGMLCSIWNQLAATGLVLGADLFLLVGDNVKMETMGWKTVVERKFAEIAHAQRLPFGRSSVAFRDRCFEGFPTFPVLHASHLRLFGQMLPSDFINQDGDPYLFALYRRWGAAAFCDATLTNGIGGDTEGRYLKQPIVWKSTLLPEGLQCLEEELGPPTTICLDVVIPSFRCDVGLLKSMVTLPVPKGMSLAFTIIVDNPRCPHLETVRQLALLRSGISIIVNPQDRGVSASRNAGLASTDGDYVLFLDDDVDVADSPHLLWYYQQAIYHHPEAEGFVGLTELPSPTNRWTEALHLSGITYFYGIARRLKSPPWGVGANLLLKRGRDDLFFRHYRHAGGGEDVDICLRARKGERNLISVPQAVVKHPWWKGGASCYSHIAGWAVGDSLGVAWWPQYSILTWPASPVMTLVLLTCLLPLPAIMVMLVDMIYLTYHFLMQHGLDTRQGESYLVAGLSASIIMVQEVTRVAAHMWRLEPTNIFFEFDWLDTKGAEIHPTRGLRFLLCLLTTLSTTTSPSLTAAYSAPWMLLAPLALLLLMGVSGWRRRERRKGTDFVVLSHKRCGSNLLCGILHLHPEILMHNELFNVRQPFSYHPDLLEAGGWSVAARDKDPGGFLRWIFESRPRHVRRVVGFKSFEEHWQGREGVYHSLLSNPRVKKIILQRRDLLRTYVSYVRSEKTRSYIKASYAEMRVEVEKKALLSFGSSYQACFRRYREATRGQGVLRVTYEDLVGSGRQEVMKEIYHFLGVTTSAPFHILPSTRKQSGEERLEEVVVNYEELLGDPVVRHLLQEMVDVGP